MNTDKCLYCDSAETRVKYDLGSHKIVKCRGCGLMRLSPMPSLDDTKQVYSDLSYFQNPEFYDHAKGNLYGYVDYIAERVNKLREHRPIAEFLRDRHGQPQRIGSASRPRLLDIGCGLGYFLDAAQDVGFEVAGVEFNPQAVRAIRQKYAFPVYEGAVETQPIPEGSFDVVTMFDVIEHLHDPFTTLKRLRSLLRPGGGLALSTMDSESFSSRLLGKRLEDFRRTREHLFFFSRETITKILESCGFTVYKINSYGHTFELAFLLERLAIINRPVFMSARWVVNHLGIGRARISVDPHTKMIVYAQRPHETVR
jgi:2-polyprenyl-3-methyl-5-hydroxy-6-metoxy-1,4-benzoquinol methylase